MYILLGQLLVVYISGIFSRIDLKKKILIKDEKKYNNLFILMIIILLSLISGLRYGVGTDYGTYVAIYKNSLNVTLQSPNSEVGFFILNRVLNYFSSNPQLMFLITAIITNTIIVVMLRKKSEIFELSIFLYITTFMYYSTFNILRQWIAVAILFTGTKYLINRECKGYFIIVLFAYLFHKSSIIMIPIYFLVDQKLYSKRNLILVFVAIAIFILYDNLLSGFFEILETTVYSNYIDEFSNEDRGVHLLRVIVYLLPIIVTFIFYNKINKNNDNSINVIINMCFIGALVMFLALKHAYFARLTYLFELYYLLLIPKITKIGDKKLNRLIYYVILISYLSYSIALLKSGESNILPYRWQIPKF